MRSEIRLTAAAVGRWPRGVFRVPRRLQERGTRVARARGIGRALRGCREVPGLRRRDGGRLRGVGSAVSGGFVGRGGEVRGTHTGGLRGVATVGGFGASVRRFGLLHRPLRCEVRGTHADGLLGGAHGVAASGRIGGRFGRLHRPWGARCAGLAPTACAAAFMVRRFGRLHRPLWGGCTGLTPATCAAAGRGWQGVGKRRVVRLL